MIDNSKETIPGAVAVKALNTIKIYCATHLCPDCPLREDLEKDNHCPIPKLALKKGIGFFKGIDSQDLVKHGEIAVRIKANGLVKVGAQRDGRIKILGKAKCHPNDAFNLETGDLLGFDTDDDD